MVKLEKGGLMIVSVNALAFVSTLSLRFGFDSQLGVLAFL